MHSLTQVIYQRGLAFTYLNFKNLELLNEHIDEHRPFVDIGPVGQRLAGFFGNSVIHA